MPSSTEGAFVAAALKVSCVMFGDFEIATSSGHILDSSPELARELWWSVRPNLDALSTSSVLVYLTQEGTLITLSDG